MVDKNKHGEIVKAESKNLDFYYADGTQALKNVSLPVYYCAYWSIRLR
jgi:phosphate transport system ATP-binding protein